MSWNGSGTFTRLYSWLADAAAGIDITASRVDDDTNNITAVGFANCLTRDGQGSATALLPMNGFRHTGVSPGVALTDYAAVSQLIAPGSHAAPPFIAPGAYLGEIRSSALPESALAALMPGWYVCAGGTRPRTDPLWLATGAINPANWAFGNGDGTTTYTLPDRRGRVAIGKDDMGGAAANRVTAGVSGVPATTLGGSGGDQHAQQDTIATGLTGSVTAGSSSTSVVTETPHAHSYQLNIVGAAITAGGATNFGVQTPSTTGATATGLTVATSTTTTITNTMAANSTSSLTGAAQNVPPALIENIVIFTGA